MALEQHHRNTGTGDDPRPEQDSNGAEIVDASVVPESLASMEEAEVIGDGVPVQADVVPPGETVLAADAQDSAALASVEIVERPPEVIAEAVTDRSWVFRLWDWAGASVEWLLGAATLVVLLAVASAIPVVQLLTLGYLLECSGRIGRSGRLRDGLPGVRKASRIGSAALGTWLCLLPVQYVSELWYASNLLDPSSPATTILRVVQVVITALALAHVVAAWYCGGRLRHFFWPLVAPFSMTLWSLRKAADSRAFRPGLNRILGWISPRLVQDICRARPLTNWFLPAVILKGIFKGRLLTDARDGLWRFVAGLHLPELFWLGFRGFVGTVAWLFVPTMLLLGMTALPDAPALLSGLLGMLLMTFALLYVPFAQTHFATERRMDALFDLSAMRRAFRGSPFMHWLALFLLLLLALPLFLFKIERIPPELLWVPGLLFVSLMLPARLMLGWAYAKGIRRVKKRLFVWTWSSRLGQVAVTFSFTLFLVISQYIAWSGSLSLFEHHEVLVPAPFLRIAF